jgi:hypothetical protein
MRRGFLVARFSRYAPIDVIDRPGRFYHRDIGGRAVARDPIQLDRITPGSTRF